MKKLLKCLGILLGLVVLAAAGLVVWLSATEFRPEPVEAVRCMVLDNQAPELDPGRELTILTWNTGYGGLGWDSDFFMDGGEMVDPPSQKRVLENLASIRNFLNEEKADAYLLQEVDYNSARTKGFNQLRWYEETMNGCAAYAQNYKCAFVPFPLPPIGRIDSGIATYTPHLMDTSPQRISLPCPFSWPVRLANLKRCLLVTRIPWTGADGERSGKELVLVNLHLEAYDDGAGKAAQTEMLKEVLQQEYEKGNYVIAGGDFNQTFPGSLEVYPIKNENLWTPGVLENEILPEGWRFAYDVTVPTCRLLNQPYVGEEENTQFYVIDGFIVSPNVTVESVETVNCDFAASDHNPVRLRVTLK